MTQIVQQQQGQYYWLFDQDYFYKNDFDKSESDVISSDFFQHEHWYREDAVTGVEKGRGTTLFVRYNERELVLRHYLRGGLVSKFNKDKYWFKSWRQCRSIAEFHILNQLIELGLPVPKPVAAQVKKSGLRYQADIMIERIDGARDLLSTLKQDSQSDAFYQSLAELVARFHRKGVYHADLNIQNILYCSDGKFWLIDFDRAQMLSPQASWQRETISRLKRSFEKEKVRHGIQWHDDSWVVFEKAYQSAMQTG